jgi:hypothetical protein
MCRALLELIKRDIKPRDIMTRAAFENAMVPISYQASIAHVVPPHPIDRMQDGSCNVTSAGTTRFHVVVENPTSHHCKLQMAAAWQVLIMALGGSTNAVLHLIAMARAAGVEVTLDDFQARFKAPTSIDCPSHLVVSLHLMHPCPTDISVQQSMRLAPVEWWAGSWAHKTHGVTAEPQKCACCVMTNLVQEHDQGRSQI